MINVLKSLSASQASLSSSVFEFIHEHGHRYHRKGEALLPNDETEQNRLDLQHHIFRMLLDGGLTLTNLQRDEALQILDVGCGTGIWAIEMGDALPNATIQGIEYILSYCSLPCLGLGSSKSISTLGAAVCVEASRSDYFHNYQQLTYLAFNTANLQSSQAGYLKMSSSRSTMSLNPGSSPRLA